MVEIQFAKVYKKIDKTYLREFSFENIDFVEEEDDCLLTEPSQVDH